MKTFTQLKNQHNERMTRYINVVATMTQEQIDACAWCMCNFPGDWTKENLPGDWTKENHIQELQDNKYEV